MKPIRQCYYPGQVNARRQRAGTLIVAIDGMLRLTYRNHSLDWLLDVTGPVSVDIEEGGCHVVPYDTLVEIEAPGSSAVNGLVSVPRSQYSLIVTIGRCSAWIGRYVRVNAQRPDKRKMRGMTRD